MINLSEENVIYYTDVNRSEVSSSRRWGPDPIYPVSIKREIYLHTDMFLTVNGAYQ